MRPRPICDSLARQQFAAFARSILYQWIQGYDACWSAGEPPHCDLDQLPSSGSHVSGAVDPLAATAWNFLDSFLDARSNGVKDLNGVPWDDAVILLERLIEQLENDDAVLDPRMDSYRVRLPSQPA